MNIHNLDSNFVISIPSWFRHDVLTKYPLLEDDQSSLRLLGYLLFTPRAQWHTDDIPLPYELAVHCRVPYRVGKDFSSRRLCEQFGKVAFPLEVKNHSSDHGRCRRVVRSSIPQELRMMAYKAQSDSSTTELVDLISGVELENPLVRFPRGHGEHQPKHEEIGWLVRYLNDTPKECFLELREHIRQEIGSILNSPKLSSADETDLRILMLAAIDPKSIFHPVSKSCRLYSDGASILQLTRERRNRILSGRHKLDLKKSQLVIAARLLDVPSILDWVERAEDLWADLADHTFAEESNPGDRKLLRSERDVIKECTYSLLFGARPQQIVLNMVNGMSKSTKSASLWARRFMDHPKMHLLMNARDRALAGLRVGSLALTDAFGNELSVAEQPVPEDSIRSVLCLWMQSYEMKIMIQAAVYASATLDSPFPAFVTEWLHDGIWVHCDHPGWGLLHVAKMKHAIWEESDRLLGIKIGIDHELPGARYSESTAKAA